MGWGWVRGGRPLKPRAALGPPSAGARSSPRPPAGRPGHSAPLAEPGPEVAGAQGAGEAGRRGRGRRARPGLRCGAERGGAAAAEGYRAPYIGRERRGALRHSCWDARGAAPLLAVGRRRRRRRQRLGTARSAPRALAAAAAAAAAEAPAVSAPRWCRLPRSFGASSLRSHHGRSGMANAGVAAACPGFLNRFLVQSGFLLLLLFVCLFWGGGGVDFPPLSRALRSSCG